MRTRSPRDSKPRSSLWGSSFSLLSFLFLLLAATYPADDVRALTFPLPQAGNNLVGQIQYVPARQEDTLMDIARRFDVGYNELLAANPDVDPWLPGEGTRVLLPTAYILPPRPWQGIVINLVEMRLYYFPEPGPSEHGVVMTYPIGIGREGWSTPLGEFSIVDKIEGPSWTAPLSIIEERAAEGVTVRRTIPPGPDNPLGEFALMLSEPGYFMHGTNRPFSIGMRVSHGCIRLYPEDINELFTRVPRKTPVRIENESYKVGLKDDVLFVEAHVPLSEQQNQQGINMTSVVAQVVQATTAQIPATDWDRIIEVANRHSGVPTPIVMEHAQTEPGKGWLLQVGAFKDRARAAHLTARLQASVPSVKVQPCGADGLCRVVAGPFADRQALAFTAQHLKLEFGIESFVISAQASPDIGNPAKNKVAIKRLAAQEPTKLDTLAR